MTTAGQYFPFQINERTFNVTVPSCPSTTC